MPSGAVYECNIVDDENQDLSTIVRSTAVDPCWQRDVRPADPIHRDIGNQTDNSEQPVIDSVDSSIHGLSSAATGSSTIDEFSQFELTTSDELQSIRAGFDKWLDAFRSSRPQRDVIWRVGKLEQFIY